MRTKEICVILAAAVFMLAGCGLKTDEARQGAENTFPDSRVESQAPESSAEDAVQNNQSASGQQAPSWAQPVSREDKLWQGLNLDGTGDADDEVYVNVYQFGDSNYNTESTVLYVRLGTGEVLAEVLPVSGFVRLQTGKLFSEDREAIVLEIENRTSNYSAADYFVFDVEFSDSPEPKHPYMRLMLETVNTGTSEDLYNMDPAPYALRYLEESVFKTLLDSTIEGAQITDIEGSLLQGIELPLANFADKWEEGPKVRLFWNDQNKKWALQDGDAPVEEPGENPLQILDMKILDGSGNEISDDGGGWYILNGPFQVQLDFQGEAEAVTVFFVPTGSSMLAHRQQIAVYPLYDEEAAGMKIVSPGKNDGTMRVALDAAVEAGLAGQLYVMVEDMEGAVFSERLNVSAEN